jgi:hypothetical protein
MKQQLTIEQLLETKSYQEAKQVIFKETNARQVHNKGFAPISGLPSFSRVEFIDYSVFKKQAGERDLIKAYKKDLPKTRTNKMLTILHEQF